MTQLKKVKGGYLVTDMRVPRNIQKAFSLSTYIATILKDFDSSKHPEITQLRLQSKRVMQVFYSKVGNINYHELSDKLGDIWEKLDKKHGGTIKEESLPALIDCMCMIVHPNDFKKMFGVKPYHRDRHYYFKEYPEIAMAVLDLDYELNALFGTKPYALQKPKEKVVKAKKARDKSKKKAKVKTVSSKKVKTVMKKKAKHAENILSLRERIAQAKQIAGEAQ